MIAEGPAGLTLSLTFDNGPHPGPTGEVLDELGRWGIGATFFVVGERLREPAGLALARRAAAEGHRIGNHTLTHRRQLGTIIDAEELAHEIDEAQRLIGDLAGDEHLVRPYGAGGVIDDRLLGPLGVAHLRRRKSTCVLWNCLPRDWIDPEGWVDRCLAQVAGGGHWVVVLHDVPGACAARLGELLDRVASLEPVYSQQFPPACVALQRGEPAAGYPLLGLGSQP